MGSCEQRQQGRLGRVCAAYIAVDAVLGIGSAILIDYREGLPLEARAGVDGAIEALFFAPSVIDWLDQGASLALKIGALTAALAVWRDFGWRVSVPLAVRGISACTESLPTLWCRCRARVGISGMAVLGIKRG